MNTWRLRQFSVVSASVVVVLGIAAAPALGGVNEWDSYAAKFVCGAGGTPDLPLTAHGKYRTIINVHNPHYLRDVAGAPIPVTFFKKVVVAKPQDEPRVRPSCKQQEILLDDEALAIDCGNIKALLNLTGLPITPQIEGFVVIEVPPGQQDPGLPPPRLDVVALYTARSNVGSSTANPDHHVKTLDVEVISPQTIIGIPVPDLCAPD